MQKLAQLCIRRPVFATMLILALVVMGLDAYRKLGVDFFPKIEFPFVTITTTLRGASPEEVETQVTKRIEEAVNTISGIDELRSISAEGISHGARHLRAGEGPGGRRAGSSRQGRRHPARTCRRTPIRR